MSTAGLILALREHGVESPIVCNDSGSREERAQLEEVTRGRTSFTPLYPWNKKSRSKRWKRPGIEAYHIWKTRALVGSIGHIVRAARRWNVSVVHTNTLLNPEGGCASRILGLPHVWHVRELVGPDQTFQFPVPILALEHVLERLADRIVTNSYTSARPFAHLAHKGRLVTIPNGIDLSPFSEREQRTDGRPVVGMVANLTSKWKRHDLFVEAAGQLASISNAEFRVYGADPTLRGDTDQYSSRLHDRVRELGLEDRFRFMGHVADPALIMKEIDVLVHPTELESFGRIAVEAMATGIPVVGVRGGGIAEVVDEGVTGLLGAVGSSTELANNTLRLLEAPDDAQRMGRAGRLRAEREYSIRTHGERMLELYEQVVQRTQTVGTRE